jgi:hypothetical protein
MGKQGNRSRQSARKKGATKRERKKAVTNPRHYAPNDGGAWALAGYAYQLLGSAVLRVASDYGTVADAGDLTLHIETYGQDAAAVQPNQVELIQFKFSENADTISPSEFADILRALQLSETQVGGGGPTVTWKLITNRDLGKRTKALRNKLRGVKLATTTTADAALIRKSGLRCAHEMRKPADLHANLERRAKSFGVTDVSSAKMHVNGYLLGLIEEPEGGRIVDRKNLEEHLAGFPNPRSMRPDEFNSFAKNDLARIIQELEGGPIDDMVPRRAVQELFEIPGLAIAVVTGHGGCGKTRSVLKALYDSLSQRKWLAGALMPGHYPKAESFELLVNRWRSEAQIDPENFGKCWKRIRAASSEFERPIIVLSLDGIDEVASTDSEKRNAEELIAHFRQVASDYEPEGLLVVTCRVRKTFDNFMKYEGAGAPQPSGFKIFPLGDFDGQEFVDVWKKWFKGEPLPEFVQQAATAPRMGGTQARSEESRMRIEALRHPALLGCVRRLTQIERQQLFQEDDAVWVKLLTSYLDWFALKVFRRIGYNEERVQAVLKAVARECEKLSSTVAIYDLEEHWVKPATKDPQLGNEMVRDVFREALSSGLVESPDSPRYTMSDYGPWPWIWRFRFLQSHFANLV